MKDTIYSIGYGNRKIDQFLFLLKKYEINLLIDIRTNPASRFQPAYNRKMLSELLKQQNIEYLFLGMELGGKPKDVNLYSEGRLDYAKVNSSFEYKKGIEALKSNLGQGFAVCIMCAELNPDECHRKNLVAETLFAQKIDTNHITKAGDLVLHSSDKKSLLF